MSTSNATPVALYGAAFRLQVPLYLTTGLLNTSPGTLSATLVKDGAAAVASTNTPVQVGSSQWVTLDLTAAETSYYSLGVTILSTATNAMPFSTPVQPFQPGNLPVDLNSVGLSAPGIVGGVQPANVNAVAGFLQSLKGIITGTVVTTTFTPVVHEFETSLTGSTAGALVGRTVLWASGANAGNAVRLTDYTYTNSKGHFFTEPNLAAPSSGDTFVIL